MVFLAAAVLQSPLQAFQPNPLGEPDPDGSPAHAINVDFRAGMETGSGYAFRDAKAIPKKKGRPTTASYQGVAV